VLIQISRKIRVTLSDTELQTLHEGEYFEVAASIGRVLVSEGYAVEAVADGDTFRRSPDVAHDDPIRRRSS
jgi:hypothetical protein